MDLSRQLARVLDHSAGLGGALAPIIWREPMASLPTCRVLDGLIARLEDIEQAASEARATCHFLWEIASDLSE